jgi:hypothetical protein
MAFLASSDLGKQAKLYAFTVAAFCPPSKLIHSTIIGWHQKGKVSDNDNKGSAVLIDDNCTHHFVSTVNQLDAIHRQSCKWHMACTFG